MSGKLLWKIGGEAGFGIMTTGLFFSKIASRNGYFIYDYFEYPSLIRGGHNTTETLISQEEVTTTKFEIDLLICLNKATFELHKKRLHKDSVVVYDENDFQITEEGFKKANLPFKKILKEHNGMVVMMNNIALGASIALLGWDLQLATDMIASQFSKKGEEVIKTNKKMAQLGYDYINTQYKDYIIDLFPAREMQKQLVMTGNDAFALGAIVADCRLYSAYPMTPSSTVLTTFASYAEKTGMVVRHAEDEIAVINTALGASWAGVRSAVGTSGGGFALMVEAISFAGIAEIPIVIFLAQRPGPATGMPTWTEQGDLLFAVHSGHGEFPKIVLAPGDVEEMYELAAEAFNLADIYQTPVIVMSDKLLSESHQAVSQIQFADWADRYRPERGKIIYNGSRTMNQESAERYLRYKLTKDGISPMLIPDASGFYYQSNSYEHVEDGHTTEEGNSRKQQVDKRSAKQATYLNNHFRMPKIIGDHSGAEIVFVSWGGNKGAIVEAMKSLQEKGKKTALYHFTHLYPLDRAAIRDFFKKDKRYILVENNAHGQFGRLLEEETGVYIDERLLKYNGRPIWAEEIIAYVTKSDK